MLLFLFYDELCAKQIPFFLMYLVFNYRINLKIVYPHSITILNFPLIVSVEMLYENNNRPLIRNKQREIYFNLCNTDKKVELLTNFWNKYKHFRKDEELYIEYLLDSVKKGKGTFSKLYRVDKKTRKRKQPKKNKYKSTQVSQTYAQDRYRSLNK